MCFLDSITDNSILGATDVRDKGGLSLKGWSNQINYISHKTVSLKNTQPIHLCCFNSVVEVRNVCDTEGLPVKF